MLGSLGVKLALWVGKDSAQSASAGLMSAIRRVTVQASDELSDGFQLVLAAAPGESRQGTLSQFNEVAIERRIIIGVWLGSALTILVDGFITNHQYAPGSTTSPGTLTVTGLGLHYKMGLHEASAAHSDKTDSQIVKEILNDYHLLDLVKLDITETAITHTDKDRARWQVGSDLAFLQRLAKENGFVFYIEPIALRENLVYFGLPKRGGVVQPELSMNRGAASTVLSLNFTFDSQSPVAVTGAVYDRDKEQATAIASQPESEQPPLSGKPLLPERAVILRGLAGLTFAQAKVLVDAQVNNAPAAVNAEGELDIVRYGAVLRPRRLVKVSGAGSDYDGNYYVSHVTHSIERASYKQKFTIKRDGTKPLQGVSP